MKLASFAFAAGFSAVLLATTAVAGEAKRPVVVELFTSQGCNSCPPADELLGRLATRPDVIAISLPVTYWDMLGWKDTLATDANTRRQKAYAQFMGRGGVYTPQIIVDGVSDVVGSREADVQAAIAKREAEIEVSESRREAIVAAHEAAASAREAALAEAQAERAAALEQAAAYRETARADLASARQDVSAAHGPPPPSLAIPVSLTETPKTMHIRVAAAMDRADHNATIWLFHLRSTVTVNIGGGENDGRSMTYRNVVGDLRPVGTWKGESISLDLPRAAMKGLPHDAVAVVVQQGGYGRVVGATLVSHPDFQASH